MSDHEMDFAVMSRRGVLGLGLATLASASARGLAVTGERWSTVERVASQAIADRVAPGLGVSVMRGGEILYAAGFGHANLETGTPVGPDSVFRIGSNSKQFTAAAILLLAEDGRLSLDDPLARFLPEVPRAGDVTLRQMLSHTSGLGNYTDAPRPQVMRESRLDYDQERLLRIMLAAEPLFIAEPGTVWAYSNTAFVFLGMVIERVTGRPYGEFIESRICAPAGLARTRVDASSDIVAGRVSGYTPLAGSPTGFANAPYISMTYPGGGGAMRSTGSDLCRWHHALLTGRVLSRPSLTTMMTATRLRGGALPMTRGGSGSPPVAIQYGLGIGVGSASGRDYVNHSGGIHGFLCNLRTYTADRLSIAVLVNSDGGENGAPVRACFDAVRAAAEAAAA